ncbi:B3 domain-containing protein [Sesamum alatum]|uniref:B3 domain-containing protein n=1 Tax=Sesamum alatum TaxID=300844 RepID=A0AAE2D0H5_9LAMI|nr:B3 domain-containing protein [Sesamum alatum]
MAPSSSCSISTLSDSAKSHASTEKDRDSSVSSTPTTTLPQHIMIFGSSIKIDQLKNVKSCVGKAMNQVPSEEDRFYMLKRTSVLADDDDHGGKRKMSQFIDFFASSDETKADQEAELVIKKRKTTVGPSHSPPIDLDLSIGRGNSEEPPAPAEDCWKIKKMLTRSDVNGSSRLLLGKVLVQEHILPHVRGNPYEGEGVEVKVWDVDTASEHILVLKFWTSSKSYVFKKNWTSDFVERRALEEKDEIGLRWDDENSRMEFTLLKKKLI